MQDESKQRLKDREIEAEFNLFMKGV